MAIIGLVVADPNALTSGESALQSLLGGDHTVTVVDDADTVPSGVDCFVITDPTSRGALGSKYTSIAVPVISLKPGAWQDLNLTSSGPSNGGSGNGLSLLEHEITAGLGSSINHLASGSSGRWGVPTSSLGSGVETFAVHPSSSTHALGIAADEGATLTSGTAPARRVGLCYLDAVAANLSSNGATLLLQAVAWALGPQAEHHEGDGLPLTVDLGLDAGQGSPATAEAGGPLAVAAGLGAGEGVPAVAGGGLPVGVAAGLATGQGSPSATAGGGPLGVDARLGLGSGLAPRVEFDITSDALAPIVARHAVGPSAPGPEAAGPRVRRRADEPAAGRRHSSDPVIR